MKEADYQLHAIYKKGVTAPLRSLSARRASSTKPVTIDLKSGVTAPLRSAVSPQGI